MVWLLTIQGKFRGELNRAAILNLVQICNANRILRTMEKCLKRKGVFFEVLNWKHPSSILRWQRTPCLPAEQMVHEAILEIRPAELMTSAHGGDLSRWRSRVSSTHRNLAKCGFFPYGSPWKGNHPAATPSRSKDNSSDSRYLKRLVALGRK